MAKLNDLIVTIGATTRDFDKGLGKAMRKMRTFGKNTKALGKSLSRNLTAPIAAMGGLAVKAAADFEFAMAKVKAVSGFTAEEVGRLEEQAKQLGASTSKSASDVAGLQLELAKLGKSSTEIEDMTESILSLSIAFDTDLGETAAVVGATLNQFGLDASESGRVADNMAVLFGSSALDLEKFDTAMRTVGPTANALGISLEDTGSALGILMNAGLDASTAGTSLTKSFTTLVKNGTPANEVLTKLTDGNLSVAESFEIFGDRAGKIVPLLQGTTGQIAELTQKQLEGQGAAVDARKELESTAMGGFAALQSAAEAASITLGQALLPTVNKVAKFITNLASGIANMNSETRESVIKFVAIAAAIGPLLVILPSLISGFTMLLSPVGLVIAAIVGLGIAIVTFADEIAPYITDVINYFITLYNESSLVRGIIGGIQGTVQVVFDFFLFAVNSVIGAFQDLGTIIQALMTGDMSLIGDAISNAFTNAVDRMSEFGKKAAEDFNTAVQDHMEREPYSLVSEDTVRETMKTLGGVTELIPTLGGGGGGAVIETPQVGNLLTQLGAGTTTPSVEGELNIVDIDMPEDIVEEEDIDAIIAAADLVKRQTKAMAQSVAGFVEHAFNQVMSGTQTFSEVMQDMIKNLVKQIAVMIAQFVVLNTLFGGVGVGGLNLSGFIQKGFGIPMMANGGLFSGASLAMVGEGSGTSSINPEVVAPLDRLQSMMGAQQVQVTGRISGRDILLTSERNAIDRNRVRGF